ncbi:phosphate acyltransferase PlsX [bacterium]|nr:phosphate acyltransferase PlsX [bacterium]
MGRLSYYTRRFARRWAKEAASRDKPTIIALDAMGGDIGPEATLEGAVRIVAEQPNLKVLLVGNEAELKAELGHKFLPEEIEIVHAEEGFGMHEASTSVLRRPDCSIMMGMGLLANGDADGFVSMGNTGAVMASALVKLGRIEGIERPPLITLFPTIGGRPTLLVDIGANVDCKPIHLLHFGEMASLYAEKVLCRDNPKVALLSIGEEKSKGNAAVKAAYPLFEDSDLNFVGNVEGGDIIHGKVDVVVMDGFVGNILLKFGEGSIGFFKTIAKKGRRNNLFHLLGGLLMKGGFRRIMKEFDYAEYGGAPLLGVNGNVVIGHGRSSSEAITNAVALASMMAFAQIDRVIARYIKRRGS